MRSQTRENARADGEDRLQVDWRLQRLEAAGVESRSGVNSVLRADRFLRVQRQRPLPRGSSIPSTENRRDDCDQRGAEHDEVQQVGDHVDVAEDDVVRHAVRPESCASDVRAGSADESDREPDVPRTGSAGHAMSKNTSSGRRTIGSRLSCIGGARTGEQGCRLKAVRHRPS